MLSDRLSELRDAGVLEAGETGYVLTEEGRVLLEAFGPLNAWAERWDARSH